MLHLTSGDWIALGAFVLLALNSGSGLVGNYLKRRTRDAAAEASEATTVKELGLALARNFRQQDDLNNKLAAHLIECARLSGHQAEAQRTQAQALEHLSRAVDALRSQMRFAAAGANDRLIDMGPKP